MVSVILSLPIRKKEKKMVITMFVIIKKSKLVCFFSELHFFLEPIYMSYLASNCFPNPDK